MTDKPYEAREGVSRDLFGVNRNALALYSPQTLPSNKIPILKN
jgi:hypothetical protein